MRGGLLEPTGLGRADLETKRDEHALLLGRGGLAEAEEDVERLVQLD